MATKNWGLIASYIKAAEGGFVDNPRDPGGATNMGVTRATLYAWRKKPVSVEDVKNLTWLEASDIYKAMYWEPVRGDLLPSGLDYAVVDAAVNSGTVQAVKWLQRSLIVPVNGHLDLLTTHAVSTVMNPVAAIQRYDAARLGFLQALRTWPIFGEGWFARVNLVTSRAMALAKG